MYSDSGQTVVGVLSPLKKVRFSERFNNFLADGITCTINPSKAPFVAYDWTSKGSSMKIL